MAVKMMKVGIDILESGRMEKLSKNNNFLNQIFTENEIKYIKKMDNFLPRMAGIFCAKEAFLKALGYGVKNGISFNEIEVKHEENGRPYYELSNHVQDVLKALQIMECDLSISHTDKISTAICIMK